jgi:FAD/FMN-containing dehydrogenase
MNGQSWGRYPKTTGTLKAVAWSTDALPGTNGSKVLPYGLGRSYGDVCLNDGGTLLITTKMDHLLAFDEQNGLLRCEAGTSLDDVLRFLVPRGWFLPTTPGTKFVTVGGAIANDVHGKNHHRAGTFGCHVTQFELLRSSGERLLCSPDRHPDWFAATIGGMGLTGLITWAEFKVRRIASASIEMESIKFENLDDFFRITKESDHDYDYTVSWQDCLARGESLGRGIFMRGNHAKPGVGSLTVHGDPRLGVPFDFPSFSLNGLSIKAFNTLYYARLRKPVTRAVVHYNPFFYPLDSINNWNRIYGARGFFQYQFVVPFSADRGAIREILRQIGDSGQGSFLAVLKTFGDIRSPGLLSFPRPGVTLALDFPNRGEETLRLFERLDQIVLAAGGRIYPAKDARMSASTFQACYPQWQEFTAYIDPAFSSSFWRRVTT